MQACRSGKPHARRAPCAERRPCHEHRRVLPHCSFCGKSADDVRNLIAGPGIYICDECVRLCDEIIAETLGPDPEALLAQLRVAAAESDELVERLRAAGVSWDRIGAALV